MKDSMCKMCVYFHIGWDMHSNCDKGMVKTDEYKSCEDCCSKYKLKKRMLRVR